MVTRHTDCYRGPYSSLSIDDTMMPTRPATNVILAALVMAVGGSRSSLPPGNGGDRSCSEARVDAAGTALAGSTMLGAIGFGGSEARSAVISCDFNDKLTLQLWEVAPAHRPLVASAFVPVAVPLVLVGGVDTFPGMVAALRQQFAELCAQQLPAAAAAAAAAAAPAASLGAELAGAAWGPAQCAEDLLAQTEEWVAFTCRSQELRPAAARPRTTPAALEEAATLHYATDQEVAMEEEAAAMEAAAGVVAWSEGFRRFAPRHFDHLAAAEASGYHGPAVVTTNSALLAGWAEAARLASGAGTGGAGGDGEGGGGGGGGRDGTVGPEDAAAAATAEPRKERVLLVGCRDFTFPVDFNASDVAHIYAHYGDVRAQNLDRAALTPAQSLVTTALPIGVDLHTLEKGRGWGEPPTPWADQHAGLLLARFRSRPLARRARKVAASCFKLIIYLGTASPPPHTHYF